MSSITCYRVRVPDGHRLSGFTTRGQPVPILPGEYLAHRVEPKVPWLAVRGMLRFVGADGRDRDIHVPLPDADDLSEALHVEVEPLLQ